MASMLHYQRVGADTVGTTTGTRETIGTVTVPSNATNLYAFILQRGSTATTTTAEATHGRVFANMRSLAFQEMDFCTGKQTEDGAGTNESCVYDPGIYYPVRSMTGRPPANEQITFQYDTFIEMTQEDYAQVFVLTSNGGIDTSVLNQRGHPLSAITKWCDWSGSGYDNDIGDATAELFANNISVPGYVKVIHAAIVTVASDAVTTAGEHFAGYLTLSGTIPGLDPMDIPLPLRAGSLGTSVDWPDTMSAWVYPMYIPGTGKNETINITANLAATTSANSHITLTLVGSI